MSRQCCGLIFRASVARPSIGTCRTRLAIKVAGATTRIMNPLRSTPTTRPRDTRSDTDDALAEAHTPSHRGLAGRGLAALPAACSAWRPAGRAIVKRPACRYTDAAFAGCGPDRFAPSSVVGPERRATDLASTAAVRLERRTGRFAAGHFACPGRSGSPVAEPRLSFASRCCGRDGAVRRPGHAPTGRPAPGAGPSSGATGTGTRISGLGRVPSNARGNGHVACASPSTD